MLPHQRSAELEPERLAELDDALLNYDGEYVSQVPHKEKASRSAAQLRHDALMRPDGSNAKEHAAGRAALDDYLADELHNIQSHFLDRRRAGASAEAQSLQSPPKDPVAAPRVLKIDDLLRESRRADFSLQAPEATSNFEMSRSPYDDMGRRRGHRDGDQNE